MSRVRSRSGFALACAVALLALLVAAAASYEVEESGRLLSSTPEEVYRVQVLGSIDLYAPARFKLGRVSGGVLAGEVLTGILLFLLSGMALLGWLLSRERHLRRFSLALSIGAAFLAADELLELSEALEYNLEEFVLGGALGEVDGPVYAAGALLFAAGFKDILLADRTALLWVGTGLAGFVLATGLDFFDMLTAPQELIEAGAVVALLIGFGTIFRRRLSQ